MIQSVKGNLLESEAQALVNTVNTVGVMGKGLALQFKEAYPNNYALYRKACKAGNVQIGKMFVTEDGDMYGGKKIIINFPTKTTWRRPSEYSYIESGLLALRDLIVSHQIKSIAIPPLGSHNGGLDWGRVKKMVIASLQDLDCQILLYEPTDEIIERMKAERVKLTPARAMLLYMLCVMVSEGEYASEFAAEKIAYFLQKFGAKEYFKLQYKECHYGPYSGKVRYVLHYLNGSYLKGVGQMTQKPFDYIWLTGDTKKVVEEYFAQEDNRKYLEICKNTSAFLSGYYSNYLLELLSTVDYILNSKPDLVSWRQEDERLVLDKVEKYISEWSDRKKDLFNNEAHIKMIIDHLSLLK